jgi:hypothetical protein
MLWVLLLFGESTGGAPEEKGHFVLRRKPQERLGRTGFFPQCGSPRSVSTLVGLGPL